MRFYFLTRHRLRVWGGVAALVLLMGLSVLSSQPWEAGVVAQAKKEVPVYSVDTTVKKVAISFDATWGADRTSRLLKIMDQYHVKSTFFLTGIWSKKYPDKVKEIAAAGHEIGNHSFNHPHCPEISGDKFQQELLDTQQLIQKLTGKKTRLFRPPYGEYSNQVIDICHRNGYEVIQWSVDSLDWKELGTEAEVDRVLTNVKPGSIVLFHNDGKYTPEALPIILKTLKERGYQVVPVGQLIYRDHYYIDRNTGVQKKK